MKFLASFISVLGALAASVGSQACMFWWVDEPKTPNSLIK
ncbi:MAG: cyclic lactone autoinducer peptide [Bacilli bacterium]|nr:cyclic lactone autoinducer peptide [Bacilli bacterium]